LKKGWSNYRKHDITRYTVLFWFSFFEIEVGTNPRKLIAAAHSGSFMQLSAYIGEAGEIDSIETKCVVDFSRW
jgi:hypothetical protein